MATPASIGVQIDLSQVEKLLADLGHKVSDLREFFYDVVDPSVTEMMEKQFKTEGAHLGKKWRPIASLTLKLRSRRGHGHGGSRILWDQGMLRRDWLYATGSGFRSVKPQEYRRGVLSLVAALHQEGWTSRSVFGQPRRKPVRVPARPQIPDEMPKSIVDQWVKSYVGYLEKPT